MTDYLLVREPSAHGYSRASWEINLGCNYQCKHCYLGLKVFSGMSLADKLKVLGVVRDAGVLFFQITGGEPTVDKHFMHTYEAAFRMGMMLTVSTNASLLWRENLLSMFERFPPYRVTVSMYGATKTSYDELTQRKGAWDLFQRGMTAAREAGLPLRLSIIVTEDSAHEEQQMIALAEHWGIEHPVYTNMTPTIYGAPNRSPLSRKSTCGCASRSPGATQDTPSSTSTRTVSPRSARSGVTTTSIWSRTGSTASHGSAPSPTGSCFAPAVAQAARSPASALCAARLPSTTRRRGRRRKPTVSTE